MVVARPLSVWLCLAPMHFERREIAFISWVGLASLLQGSTIAWSARRLGVALPDPDDEVQTRVVFGDFVINARTPLIELCDFYGLPAPDQSDHSVDDRRQMASIISASPSDRCASAWTTDPATRNTRPCSRVSSTSANSEANRASPTCISSERPSNPSICRSSHKVCAMPGMLSGIRPKLWASSS